MKRRKRKGLIASIIEGDRYKTDTLDEKACKVEKCEDAVSIARAYEDIVKTKKKNIVCFADRQGLIYF